MRELASEARDRLVDLKHQVDSLRRACPTRDRPLCDTVESSGLDISIRTDMVCISDLTHQVDSLRSYIVTL